MVLQLKGCSAAEKFYETWSQDKDWQGYTRFVKHFPETDFFCYWVHV